MRPLKLTNAAVALISCALLPLILHAQDPSAAARSNGGPGTLTNPILPSGADPWIAVRDGYYFYIGSRGNSLVIWKTRNLADLKNAENKVVWRPPATGPNSREIWAPELHFVRGKWYIYFAADAGSNRSHRLWVLENPSSDPLQGEWTLKGKIADPSDKWAIDGTVFETGSKLYMAWSGWEGDVNGTQSIYIARLKNPWTVAGKRVMISTPRYPWEKVGDLKPGKDPSIDPPHVDVNEGPAVIQHEGKIFLTYSASGCWTDYYALGMLTASASSNLLNPASWKKSQVPVFWQSGEAHAYGTGHNSFFKSPDGKEDWILYHANSEPNQGCGGRRAPRAQPFTWKPDGTPDFGPPLPAGQAIPGPSAAR
jgi:GH43 family beta-xylosidase